MNIKTPLILALICGILSTSGIASAETAISKQDRFDFTYDVIELRDNQKRIQVEKQLHQKAMHFCRRRHDGVGRNRYIRSCQKDLVDQTKKVIGLKYKEFALLDD